MRRHASSRSLVSKLMRKLPTTQVLPSPLPQRQFYCGSVTNNTNNTVSRIIHTNHTNQHTPPLTTTTTTTTTRPTKRSTNNNTLSNQSQIIRRYKSTFPDTVDRLHDEIYDIAYNEAQAFDSTNNYQHVPFSVPSCVRSLQKPIEYIPLDSTTSFSPPPPPPPLEEDEENDTNDDLHYTLESSQRDAMRYQIPLTPYAKTGMVQPAPEYITLQDEEGRSALRRSGHSARRFLNRACRLAREPLLRRLPSFDTDDTDGTERYYRTTGHIDALLHRYILRSNAYPSPLNYAGFPRTVCSSINEVVCHGIPDGRRLQDGDIASFDVSCYVGGYHGDNCATVLIGDYDDDDQWEGPDKDGIDTDRPLRTKFDSDEQQELFVSARRLIQASRTALSLSLSTIRPGSCLSAVGNAVSSVADAYGYVSVEKYRGHGIGTTFHSPPFVKHYRNTDRLELRPGVVFTVEPMLVEGGGCEVREWERDGWTVVTESGGRSSQFEHMVAVTEDGIDILTELPE